MIHVTPLLVLGRVLYARLSNFQLDIEDWDGCGLVLTSNIRSLQLHPLVENSRKNQLYQKKSGWWSSVVFLSWLFRLGLFEERLIVRWLWIEYDTGLPARGRRLR